MRGRGPKLGWTAPADGLRAVPREATSAPTFALARNYDFHIDRCTVEEIAGWVADRSDFGRTVTVEFALGGTPVGIATASMVRVDVEKAGRGPRACGFHWPVPEPVARLAVEGGAALTIGVLGSDGPPLTSLTLHRERSLDGSIRQGIGGALDHAIVMSATARFHAGGERLGPREPGRYELHERMFAYDGASPPDLGEGEDAALSPYLLFTRRRLRQEQKFPLDGSEGARTAFLRWYLDVYCQQRKPYRTPLGAAEVAYLNAPVRLVGLPYKVSRASLSYALTEAEGTLRLPIGTLQSYETFVAWWCATKAPALNLEDCLVPDYYVEILRRVPIPAMGEAWPLSVFMAWFHRNETRFHVLDPTSEDGRLLYHAWFLLEAVRRPGLIRFVPVKNITKMFDGEPGRTPFDAVIQSVHESGGALAELFDTAAYTELLARRGFDLTRRRFMTRDRRGNRFDAAARPPARMPTSERVLVQLIGPLQKSSGLGQATRLSAETLRRTGLEANYVDFSLDNPAPVGMSSATVAGDPPRQARINLIHLNGETVPIALAYMPDVFNGAYNIGYFFWELSTPAPPQRLALELLDEVWVATEFGVSVYRGATATPVTNIGMAFDPIEEPTRAASRAFLSERLAVGPDTFVCVATFDSFSFLERKNPHGLTDAFLAAFDRDDDVALVLKTHNRDFVADAHQQHRWDRIVEIANDDPRVILINETVKFEDLIRLKKGADAYLSLHRSEGWGFGLIEAMSIGTPVLATGYSGNVDFMRDDNSWLVDYDLVEPGPNEYIFVERGQVWAAPRLESAVAQLRAMRADVGERERRAARARRFVHETYSLDAQANRYRERIEAIAADLDRTAPGIS